LINSLSITSINLHTLHSGQQTTKNALIINCCVEQFRVTLSEGKDLVKEVKKTVKLWVIYPLKSFFISYTNFIDCI